MRGRDIDVNRVVRLDETEIYTCGLDKEVTEVKEGTREMEEVEKWW